MDDYTIDALAERNKRIAELEATIQAMTRLSNTNEELLRKVTQERDALAAALDVAKKYVPTSESLLDDCELHNMAECTCQFCSALRDAELLESVDTTEALAAYALQQQRKGAVEALRPYLWRPIEEANEDYGDIVLVNASDPGDVRLSHVCSLHWDEDSEGMTHFACVPAFKYDPRQIERGEVKP